MNYDLDLDLDNICRICLTHNSKLLNLFTSQIVDGYIKTMPEIVHDCLEFNVSEDDFLPNKICEQCKTTIISFFSFKEKCKRTKKILIETLLKSMPIKNELHETEPPAEIQNFKETMIDDEIPEAEEPEETLLEEESSIDEHFQDQVESNIEAEEVEFCVLVVGAAKEAVETLEDTTQYGAEILTKNVNSHDNKEEEYFCTFCEKVFEGSVYFEHCQMEHFMCHECYGTYESDEKLKTHMETDHKSPTESNETVANRTKRNLSTSLFCKICNKRWSNREQLIQHMKMHEAMNLTADDFECYSCDQCHNVFLKAEEFEKHIEVHDMKNVEIGEDNVCTDYQFLEEDKPPATNDLVCGYCKATYPNMTELRCHIIIHFDSFSCPFYACGCEYDTFSRLSLHIMKKHVYGEEHFCTHCQKERFETFDDLQMHIRTNCSAKKFACHHCEKKFFSNKALQLHLKQIDGKKFKCSHCSKTFAQHGELTIHNRTHTGERPFKCTICSKTYKTASMRAAHMDAHIDGKTFQCKICDKMLQSRTSYRNHMKRHTVGKSYKCENCYKSFYTKYHLFLHSKIHNKNM